MKRLSREKKITYISRLLIILSFFVIFLTPTTKAVVSDSDIRGLLDSCKEILHGPYTVIIEGLQGKGIYGQMFNDSTGAAHTGHENDIADQIAQNNGANHVTHETNKNFADSIKALDNVFMTISFLWAVIVATTRIFTELEKGKDTLETLAKYFMEICIVMVIILNISALLQGVTDIGMGLTRTVTSSLSLSAASDDLTEDDKEEALKKEDEEAEKLLLSIAGLKKREEIPDGTFSFFFWKIGIELQLMLPKMATAVINVISQFVVIQIIMEMRIRRMFAPLAVGDIYAEGMRSPGVRYLKKYLAVFLKVIACLFICNVGTQLTVIAMGYNDAGTMQRIFTIIATEASALGIMFKTGEYANDVVGV